MTTSNKARFHMNEEVFKKVMNDPKVISTTGDAAEKVLRLIQTTWPKSIGNTTARDTDKFEHQVHHQVFAKRLGHWRDGRPVVYLLINHPYAAAHQARTGAVTKSVKAAGLKMIQRKGG